MVDGFTKRYGVHDLVWYEVHEMMESAILREKQLKKWSRIAKIRLIEHQNPKWEDFSLNSLRHLGNPCRKNNSAIPMFMSREKINDC